MVTVAPPFAPDNPDFVADPYPTYAELRQTGPLHWHEPAGFWLVPRHADVDAALRDRRLGRDFTPYEPAERYGPWNRVNIHALLEMEPPDHTRLRRLVARPFTPRRVEGLRPWIRETATGLLAPVIERGGGDLVAELAEPLTVAVIAELLGIPERDRHRLRPWSNAIVALYELGHDEETADRAIQAAKEFDAYLRDLAARRRREPGEDLYSALAVQAVDGDSLSDDELVATAVLLLNAGHEASVNVLGNGALALLRHPEQLAALRAEPELLGSAVEELIRYDTPLSLFQRTVLEPAEVGGRELEPGERVGLLLGAANRDDAAFDAPDDLDVARRPNPHVGFGAGIHFCLGAPLARIELQEAFSVLLEHRLELIEEPAIRPTFQFRGYRSLDVRVV